MATIPYASSERNHVIDVDTKILDQLKMIEEWRGYTRALSEFGRIANGCPFSPESATCPVSAPI